MRGLVIFLEDIKNRESRVKNEVKGIRGKCPFLYTGNFSLRNRIETLIF